MKVPYAVLANEIEKLYAINIPADDAAIEAHITLIEEFIRASGWEPNEYLERWLQDDPSIEYN